MCYKLIFFSKFAQKGENCSRLLEQKVAANAKSCSKVAQKLSSTIRKGLMGGGMGIFWNHTTRQDQLNLTDNLVIEFCQTTL